MAPRRKRAGPPKVVETAAGTVVLIPGHQLEGYAERAAFVDQVDGLIVTTKSGRGLAWVPEPYYDTDTWWAYRMIRDTGSQFYFKPSSSTSGPTLAALLDAL
jgi:hypothetical protein